MTTRKGRWVVPAVVFVCLAHVSPARGIPPWLGERPAPEPAEVEPTPEPDAVPPPVAPPAVRPSTHVPLAVAVDFEPAPLASAPSKKAASRRPLYKSWVFWTFSASLLVLTVVVAVAVTESPPAPYPGTLGTVVF